MKIRYMSDLHDEIYRDSKKAYKFRFLDSDPESVLVLAGDIDLAPQVHKLLNKIKGRFKAVVYVPGNHESYNGDLEEDEKILRGLSDELNMPELHYLNNDLVKIEDVTFLGTRLWTNFDRQNEMVIYYANTRMNDFVKIRDHGSFFNPLHWLRRHQIAVRFLESNLEKLKGEKTVVVTHHAPSFRSISPEYVSDSLNGAYASDLSELILDYEPNIWIHGHIHSNSDYVIGETRILANPNGYYGYRLNGGFKPRQIINV